MTEKAHSKEVHPKKEAMPSKIEKKEHHTEEKPSTTVKISVEKKEENTISQKQVHQKPKEDLFLPSLFGRWSTQEVKIHDYSLAPYINLESRFVLHSFGRNAKQPFGKAKLNIVERLINKIMRAGQGKRKMSGKFIRGRHGTGRKIQAMQIVENAFERIEHETKQNPLQILIDAIEHATVREDTTRIKRGGVAYSVSVDVAPMKRVDEAIKNLALSGFAGSFKKKTPAHEALAREIILAAKGDNASFSIKRRDEVERIAMASR